MPRVRDLLHRFRPSGAPGAPSISGVPADRTLELATQLEPVFAQLAGTEERCARTIESGRRRAEDIRLRDLARAQAVLTAGQSRVEGERAAASAAARAAGHGELSSVDAEADRRIAQLGRVAERLVPGYLDQVRGSVEALLEEGPR